MSILFFEVIPPEMTVKYLKDSVPNSHRVGVGASSRTHIEGMIKLLKQNFPE